MLVARCTVSTAAHDKFSPVFQVRSPRHFFRGGTMKVAGNVDTIRKPNAELYYALDLPAFSAGDSALLLSRILFRESMPPSSSLLRPVPLPGPSTRLSLPSRIPIHPLRRHTNACRQVSGWFIRSFNSSVSSSVLLQRATVRRLSISINSTQVSSSIHRLS
jgi:hypothetical protein